ncbi:MAG: hypothetical protein ACRDFA_11510 [bacterium]
MTDATDTGTKHEPVAPNPKDREMEREMDPTKRERREPPDLGGHAPHTGDRPIDDDPDDKRE